MDCGRNNPRVILLFSASLVTGEKPLPPSEPVVPASPLSGDTPDPDSHFPTGMPIITFPFTLQGGYHEFLHPVRRPTNLSSWQRRISMRELRLFDTLEQAGKACRFAPPVGVVVFTTTTGRGQSPKLHFVWSHYPLATGRCSGNMSFLRKYVGQQPIAASTRRPHPCLAISYRQSCGLRVHRHLERKPGAHHPLD